MLRRLIGEDIELAGSCAGSGQVKVDPGQIEQVIMNLAVNSRDAMPEGGTLTIADSRTSSLDENYSRTHTRVKPGPYVMLAVIDTGTGMDPETRARLFEPFFTTKGQGRGTGLGLSIVFGIVRQTGGNVEVFERSRAPAPR